MNGNVKLKSKYLLTGNNARLFAISAVSTLLRRGLFSAVFLGGAIFLRSDLSDKLISDYGEIPFYTVFIFTASVILFFVALFSSTVRLGEQFAFFIRASGGKGRFFMLFHFMPFKKSIKALNLYLKINLLKLIWLIYYMTPCALCLGIIFYIYTYAEFDFYILLILSAGFSLLFSISLFMWRITSSRFSAAPIYLCLNPEMKTKKAIKKSIRHTDGYLKESVLLESSFAGWLLSCILIIPIFYVLPYTRLSKAVFINRVINERVYKDSKETYAVNFLKMNPEMPR